MKIKNLKLKALSLLAIITLSLSVTSCGDDGDDAKSFLEKHGGTVWKFIEPVTGASVYSQINSTISNPFEIWASLKELPSLEKI